MEMEAHYMRRTQGGMHVHNTAVTDCIYFPHQKLVLYKQRLGTFSSETYSIETTPEILKEIQTVVEGTFESNGKVSYGFLKRIEVDSKEGMSLIEDARKEKALRQDVQGGIEKLIARGKE